MRKEHKFLVTSNQDFHAFPYFKSKHPEPLYQRKAHGSPGSTTQKEYSDIRQIESDRQIR